MDPAVLWWISPRWERDLRRLAKLLQRGQWDGRVRVAIVRGSRIRDRHRARILDGPVVFTEPGQTAALVQTGRGWERVASEPGVE